MSDIDSTAATRQTPFSPVPSSYTSPAPSQSNSAASSRSPSPTKGDSKTRRFDIWFPEHGVHLKHNSNDVEVKSRSEPFHLSHSVPKLSNLPSPRQKTFLGYDREFIAYILSTRGVMSRTMEVLQHHDNLPVVRGILELLPVISADNLYFYGWREKVDTWPMDKGRCTQRSFTFPH